MSEPLWRDLWRGDLAVSLFILFAAYVLCVAVLLLVSLFGRAAMPLMTGGG